MSTTEASWDIDRQQDSYCLYMEPRQLCQASRGGDRDDHSSLYHLPYDSHTHLCSKTLRPMTQVVLNTT